MKFRILVCLVAIAVAASIARYATHGPSRLARHAGQIAYTTTDVVEYLAFATGRVAADHPTLGRTDEGAAKTPPAGQLRAVAESVTSCIRSIDAAAAPALTAAFNAADPQRLDSAVHRFNAAAKRWLAAPYKQEVPCPPPPPPPSVPPDKGSAPGWWKINGDILAEWLAIGAVVAAAGVSVTVGAVFNVLVLAMSLLVVSQTAVLVLWIFPAFLSYEFENTPTDLDRQTAIAKIVQALRS